MDHEGLRRGAAREIDREAIGLLKVGRRFRLPGGSLVILGRDAKENQLLSTLHPSSLPPSSFLLHPSLPGPTAYIPVVKSESDLELARGIVRAWSRGTTESDRTPFKPYQLT